MLITLKKLKPFIFILFLAGCASTQSPIDQKALPDASLFISCSPDDSLLYIDDEYMGITASFRNRALPIPAGVHRLEIKREGFFSHLSEISLKKKQEQQLTITLRKEPF